MDMLTQEERDTAEAYRKFDETPSVKEIMRQHREGLMSTIEMVHAVADVWNYYKRLPQNAHVKFFH